VDVTYFRDATTRMGVWTVTGIVIAPLHVDKVVPMSPVNAGQDTAHRVTTDMWV